MVTGGCGYVGSHTVVDLLEKGNQVISVDNLSNAYPSVVKRIEKITNQLFINYNIDLLNYSDLSEVFKAHNDISGIIHFAAFKNVGESEKEPLKYYKNNLNSLINLLNAMSEFEVNHLIFSSSCTVYGNAEQLPVTEEAPLKKAESVYGHTKQIGEDIIINYLKTTKNKKAVLLRYFNPAGAHETNLIGEDSLDKTTYLVPVIMETAIGSREKITVFGTDYNTRDGSCVRDFIHIMDLAEAHTKALQFLSESDDMLKYEAFNLGIGKGVTVLEAVNAFQEVSGIKLNYELGPRRQGDVEAIYSNFDKAAKMLNWQPSRSIEDIMRTAWNWEKVRKTLRE